MNDSSIPPINAVNLMNEGIIILFQDGKCGFFSTLYLYAHLSEVQELDETTLVW